ncbi:hypothetical protein [Daejeonella lutea]|uniref:Uncharacterized protein n=1 Tax=Daejeonella lutea TaxID=572036 RepID=A0A1T5CXR8_9SPHI|nr:hypothetical protein [Daejeonella lutea]SKB64254.1 hypothetical protein SAMN05661099_2007 [Daejeonella lutea]
MYFISIVLAFFWLFIFLAAGSKLYEVLKHHQKISLRDGVLIFGSLVMAVWFFVEKLFLNER